MLLLPSPIRSPEDPRLRLAVRNFFCGTARNVTAAMAAGSIKKHAADLQLPVVQEQSDGALFWKITNGNPDRGIPSFSKLPEPQRWQLVLYLRTLRKAEGQP